MTGAYAVGFSPALLSPKPFLVEASSPLLSLGLSPQVTGLTLSSRKAPIAESLSELTTLPDQDEPWAGMSP